MATIWPHADESDACNGDLVVAIIEVITGNTILTKNHLISSEDLFGLNLKQLKKKLWKIKEIGQTRQRGRRRGDLGRGVATARKARAAVVFPWPWAAARTGYIQDVS